MTAVHDPGDGPVRAVAAHHAVHLGADGVLGRAGQQQQLGQAGHAYAAGLPQYGADAGGDGHRPGVHLRVGAAVVEGDEPGEFGGRRAQLGHGASGGVVGLPVPPDSFAQEVAAGHGADE
ncbi:hypothetical protein [Streptomyces enissocaesilis]|uniref:hypothetical protein n=1 Tax=Streptomyces enissocaesilis TaxID=332589 RepID=UPI0031CE9B2A